jgi:predicted methyltransferase
MGVDGHREHATAGEELAAVVGSVAAAVGLQEGEAGVRRILSAIHAHSPAATRDVSRRVGIPVPLVTAVGNELRRRGILTRDRPARLTPLGAALLDAGAPTDAWCPECHGHGLVLPAALRPAAARLAALTDRAPRADPALDQSHCTAETKLRRVALLLGLDLLPADSLLLVGDDDLMSLALAAASAAVGRPLVRRLAVVDISAELLDFIRANLGDAGIEVSCWRHDLRDPLPEPLRGRFETAMTDPPYTAAGARLFLSRVVEGLRPGPGHAIAFSFGPKGPDDTLALQRAVTEIGLTIQATYRGFNEYLGSGLLGGTSHLYWLATTAATASTVPGHYPGPLYTADLRAARAREYRCLDCGTSTVVGKPAPYASAGQLKAAGCPGCGGSRFRPHQLLASPEPAP